jgi:hypothetical protein
VEGEAIKKKEFLTPKATVTTLNPYNPSTIPPFQIEFNIGADIYKPVSNFSIKAEVYVSGSDGETSIYEFFYGQLKIEFE